MEKKKLQDLIARDLYFAMIDINYKLNKNVGAKVYKVDYHTFLLEHCTTLEIIKEILKETYPKFDIVVRRRRFKDFVLKITLKRKTN